jgi:hypothetical protein
MKIDAQLRESNLARKPRHVALEGEYLAADFKACQTYPLVDAAREGRALQALVDARSEDGVCAFTKSWGFLHDRIEGGRRTDRFPLALFHLHQRYFLALTRLSTAVRCNVASDSEDRAKIAAALLALKASRTQRDAYLYRRPPTTGVDMCLTAPEQAFADQGVPASELVQARSENRQVFLPEYAARTLASELDVLQHLRPVRKSGGWAFEEIPIVVTLVQVLCWTVRSRYRVLHHYFCEACGQEAISGRSDARFCKPECSTRVRVARFRQQRKAAAARARSRS